MKKQLMALFIGAGLVSATWAQTTIINTDFDSPEYSDGDIIGQNGWMVSPNTGVNAFNIIGAASDGWADTVAAVGNFDTNTGNYAYLNGVSVGNATDTEWNSSMDFSLSVSTNIPAAGDIFRIGTSSDTGSTTGLIQTVEGDVYVRVRLKQEQTTNQTIQITTHDVGGATVSFFDVDETQAGWDVDQNQLQTDDLRLLWNVRKTRDSGIYRLTCTLTNLNPASTFSITGPAKYIQRQAAYDAGSSTFVMGHALGAPYLFTNSTYQMSDITIDSLSVVETNNVVPVLETPVVSVVEGDTVVDLSWDDVPEADSYSVKRSDDGIGGTYATKVTGLSTNGWQDTAVVNGDEYYYIVTATATGADPVESNPVLGAPDVAQTGTFLDHTFIQSEGFDMGDLAGQQRWKAIANSNPEAFFVNTNGNGYAGNEAYSNSVSSTSAQVYYNKITSNGVGHAWSGTLDFTLVAEADGGYLTNTYNTMVGTNSVTVTNIQPVASLTGSEVFHFGISSDVQDSNLQPKGDGDALINLKYGGSGNMVFGFNNYNATANIMLDVPRSALGWDPQWQDQPASNGPIMETEPVSLDWTIRKATTTNTYNAQVTVNVGTNSFTSIVVYTDASDTKNRPTALYKADLVRFAMGQKVKSEEERVYVSVDAVSATHTNASDIPIGIPDKLKGTQGNLAINLSWAAGGEQDSFNVYRSEVDGGPHAFVTTVTDKAYSDSGLTDLRTYFYVVTANYAGPTESDDSNQLTIRALGIENPLSFGTVVENWCTAAFDMNKNNNGITETSPGTRPVWSGTVDTSVSGYDASYDLHMIVQEASDHSKVPILQAKADDTIRIKLRAGGTFMCWVEDTANPENTAGTAFEMKVPNFDGTSRAIVRGTDGTWYASETTFPNASVATLTDLSQEKWAVFTPVTSAASNLLSMAGLTYELQPSLTQVEATGYFNESTSTQARNMEYWKLNIGSAPSAYDNWSDSYGIYNDDAASTNDYDFDGANNVWEWGLGGDPTDANDVGITDRFGGVDGSTFVYIYPRLKDANARPAYYLTESDNLQYTEFTNQEGDYEITPGSDWPDEPDFEAVTNEIPTTDAVKFIQLQVE